MSAEETPPATGWRGTRTHLLVAAALTLVAALPRFVSLGEASLTGDEDYTYLAAHAVLAGEGSRMPSGMPYRRALPLTWANAAAVAVLGDREGIPEEHGPVGNAPYRITAALAGTVTPAVLYLTSTAFVAAPVALVAAGALVVSEWHVAHSRRGRMYAPFLLAYVLSGFLFWRWVRTGSTAAAVGAIATYALTMSLQLLGLPAPMFALFALVLPGPVAVAPALAVGVAAGAAGVGYALQAALVQRPFVAWSLPFDYILEGMEWIPPEPDPAGTWSPVALGLGAVLGGWLAGRLTGRMGDARPHLARAAVAGCALAAGVLVASGHLWGASLALGALLLVEPHRPRALLERGGLPLALLAAVALGWAAFALVSMGGYDGLRRLAALPYPSAVLLWPVSPPLVLLVGTVAVAAALGLAGEHEPGLRAAALAVLVPVAGLGLMQDGGQPRYLFLTYPYLLLCAGYALVVGARGIGALGGVHRPGFATFAALVVVVSGALTGHGVAATLRAADSTHGGRLNPAVYGDPYRVDHEAPGRHVRARLAPGDAVIAEDVTIALVYAGRADYWLRRPADAAPFVYLGADGTPRDRYADARLLPTLDAVHQVVEEATGNVWLITSGETAWRPEVYHTAEMAAWLDSLRQSVEPAALGRDGVTAAYCLTC